MQALLVCFGLMLISISCLTAVLKRRLDWNGIENELNMNMIYLFVVVFSGALFGFWYWFSVGYSLSVLGMAVCLTIFSGLGISLGLHRYNVHGSFKAHPIYVFLLAMSHWLAGMRKKTWVPNHLWHHAHEDTYIDVHSPWYPFNGGVLGWVWSHMGWLMINRKDIDVPALSPQSLLFVKSEQYLFYPVFLGGFLIPWYLFGLEGLLLAGFVRVAYVWHVAFSINSTGHMFGKQMNEKSRSRNGCWISALFCFIGEVYHANHHADQRCAFLGWRWFDIDAGKWMLLILEKLGVVYEVRRPRIKTAF